MMAEDVKQPGRNLCLLILVSFVLLYFWTNFHRAVVPGAVFSELQGDLNITASGIAGIGASFIYTYAFCQLFAGFLADKYGGIRVVFAGGLLFCSGTLLLPFCHTLLPVCCCRAAAGIGFSAVYLSMVTEICRLYRKNYEMILGAGMMIGYLGSMAANAPFVMFAERFGWRTGLIVTGIPVLILWLAFTWILFTVKLSPVKPLQFSLQSFRPALAKGNNWCLALLTGCSFAVFYVFLFVLGKKFLEDFCRMSPVGAGWCMTAASGFSALACLILPAVSRMIGNRKRPVMIFCGTGTLVCSLVMTGALLLGVRDWRLFLAAFLMLAICANSGPVLVALYRETNPPEVLGVCVSFSNFMSYILLSVSVEFAGKLMDLFQPELVNGVLVYGTSSYLTVFIFSTVLSLAAFLFSLRLAPE